MRQDAENGLKKNHVTLKSKESHPGYQRAETSQPRLRRHEFALSGRWLFARLFSQRRDPEIDRVLELIFTGEHGDNLIRPDSVHREVM
jgi:hypothetical protein